MIIAAVGFALGALVFVEQDIVDLDVGTRDFLSGAAPANVQVTDFDADGEADLLLPGTVRLRRDGAYPDSALLPLPEDSADSHYLASEGLLYQYDAKSLRVYRLRESEWVLVNTYPLDHHQNDSRPTGFLWDVAGDASREFLVLARDRLFAYRLEDPAAPLGGADLYPPLRPVLKPATDLWTLQESPRAGAVSTRRFECILTDRVLTTLEALSPSSQTLQYLRRDFRLHADEGKLEVEALAEERSPSIPKGMIPCRLNGDESVDFAGLRSSTGVLLPGPQGIQEALMSTDFGETVQRIRTRGLASHLALADYDADGDLDLLVERGDVMVGPPKEALGRLLSKKRLTVTAWVYVQQTGGLFDLQPRRMHRVNLEMQRPAWPGGERWNAWRAGGLISASADINGDNRVDVIAWSWPGEVSIYLNHDGIFESKPDATIQAPKKRSMTIADVDLDGRDDIVFLPTAENDRPTRVFFSRQGP